MNSINPKISIIVPVYKVEDYLEQCLSSILKQTFQDWECILVDDGSPDSSGCICDRYAEKDSRFRVIHKENGGVSSARNEGLKHTSGEWVYFVDSDDTLYPDALSIFEIMTEESVDAIMAGYTISQENYDRIILKNSSLEFSKKSIRDTLLEMYKPTDFPYQGYLWCKLFRKSIIDNYTLRFNESIYFNEDRLFIVEYLCKCINSIAYTTKPVYGYINRSSGAMSSLQKSYNLKFITDFVACCMMYNIINSFTKDKQLITYAKEGIYHSFQQNMRLMEKSRVFNKEGYVYMRRELRKTNVVKLLFHAPIRLLVGNLLRLFLPTFLVKLNKYYNN